jgi:hypothetical protein
MHLAEARRLTVHEPDDNTRHDLLAPQPLYLLLPATKPLSCGNPFMVARRSWLPPENPLKLGGLIAAYPRRSLTHRDRSRLQGSDAVNVAAPS